jgi:hypothetical protein
MTDRLTVGADRHLWIEGHPAHQGRSDAPYRPPRDAGTISDRGSAIRHRRCHDDLGTRMGGWRTAHSRDR